MQYELKIESSGESIEIVEKNMITSAEIMFDTINNDTKAKSNAILARLTICGKIYSGKDGDITDKMVKISNWSRDLNEETTYRNVNFTVKSDGGAELRTYEIPDMFVCDYKEIYKSDENKDTTTFELKLTQSANKLSEIKTY